MKTVAAIFLIIVLPPFRRPKHRDASTKMRGSIGVATAKEWHRDGQVWLFYGESLLRKGLLLRYSRYMQHRLGRLVAIVEDEEAVRSSVGLALQREGLQVASYADGLQAWEAFSRTLPDLVVLDIIMPRLDGLELCRRLRRLSQTLPIIMLTSRDEELDRVLGLELGADDYLCKPFSLRELIARIRVLFRRVDLALSPPSDKPKVLRVASLVLDLDRFSATWNEQPLPLTVTEFRLLETLVRHPGHVKTRQQLMESGYPDDAYVTERAIDTHIKRLRHKFTALDPAFAALETVHGLGYRYRPG